MTALTTFALRRPRVVLVAWLLATVALAVNGGRLESDIAPTSVTVPGTDAQAAQRLLEREIGNRGQVPILLEGPSAEVRAQADRLTNALRRDTRNTVLSSVDPGAPPQLRPVGGGVLVLVERPTGETFGPATADAVRKVVRAQIVPPVHASLTGFSAIGGAISEASVSQAHSAELLAFPILLIVLLLVFRSPLAAAIPALLGGATVASALGLADLVARTRDVTDVCPPIASMMGLALGVDYSLLIVSRFREARRNGLEVPDAATLAARTSGRTVVVAGGTLLVTMAVAILLAPGTFLQSAAIGAAAASVVAVASALTAVPAALVLVGRHLERFRFGPPPRDDGGIWGRLADVLMRRPIITALPAVAVLAALAIPGVGLDSGPPDVRVLPPETQVRIDTEHVARALGPGWSGTLELIAVDRAGTLITPRGKLAVEGLQRRLAADPDVVLALPRTIGRTAVITVVPRSGPNAPDTARLYDRTRALMRGFAATTGADTAVGGVAAQLTDYRRAFNARLPWLVVALSAVAFLAFVVILRAIVLPLISVLLNVLVVAGSFGVLALVSTGPDPLLGGAGFADALSLLALLALIFGLSLDYQVFILTRLREGWTETADVGAAIRSAITRTGPVIMGAAAIMTGVFAAFATPDLQTIRQTGAGLVATVLLAGSAVCLVAVPSAMRLAGRWSFWLPGWLARVVPDVDLEGHGGALAPGPLHHPPHVALPKLHFERGGGEHAAVGNPEIVHLRLGPEHEGAPGHAAGSVLPCVLDRVFTEIAVDGDRTVRAVTLTSQVQHRAPLRLGRDLRIEARCVGRRGTGRRLEAIVHDGPFTVARATATIYVLPALQTQRT